MRLLLEPRNDLRQQPRQHRLEALAAVARRVLVAAAQALHAARVRAVLRDKREAHTKAVSVQAVSVQAVSVQ